MPHRIFKAFQKINLLLKESAPVTLDAIGWRRVDGRKFPLQPTVQPRVYLCFLSC